MSDVLREVAISICKKFGLEFIDDSGEGAFKQTFHIVNKEGLDMALKVFKSNRMNERTQREIDAMLTCDHPNIAKLLLVDTYEYKGKKYLFLLEEYLLGGTLSEKIKNGIFSISDFYNVGKDLISAVSHIASHNLVHRDIKPENIMFRKDGKTPVLVDFGLVRDLNNESLTQTWLMQGPGTPYYSAPEQLNNQKELIDWRTDQFSLGITFSLCLFGIHPYQWENDDLQDVVSRIINRERFSSRFESLCYKNRLELLLKMVSPWSIDRFRTPDHLKNAWYHLGNLEEVRE